MLWSARFYYAICDYLRQEGAVPDLWESPGGSVLEPVSKRAGGHMAHGEIAKIAPKGPQETPEMDLDLILHKLLEEAS